jgi:glycosyltransferase involved in cell wall biosynthesis
MDSDLVTATEELRKYKKIHAEWIKIALPMLAIWIGLAIIDAVKNIGLSGQELYGMIAGLSVGVIVGLLLGLKLRRDQMNAADDLLAQLKELKETDPDFAKNLKIKLIGQVDQSVVQNLEADGLTENTELVPYIPHDEVLKAQRSSQVLLLLINNTPNAKGILTGKLFEYLASGRPILCIGPEDGDAARVIKETQAGQTVDFKDKERMKEVLRNLFQKYREDGLPYNTSKEVEKYSRKDLAAEYGRLLDRTITEHGHTIPANADNLKRKP